VVLTTFLALYFIHFNVPSIGWVKLELSKIEQEQRYAFIAPLPHSAWSHHKGPSRAQILENGKPLGPGNTIHQEIRQKGEGRYSFWHNSLYFSSSDNSDPRTNGRRYTIYAPFAINATLLWFFYCLTAFSWILIFSFPESRVKVISYERVLIPCVSRLMKSKLLWLGILSAVLTTIICQRTSLSQLSLGDPDTWKYLYQVLAQGIGLTVRKGHTEFLIVAVLLLFPAYSRSDRIGSLASLCLTLALFLLPLFGIWSSGYSDGEIIGGLLPWGDASRYYTDAKRLLEGSVFSSFSARRPLFAGMLATLLGLTQQNLQATLIVIVIITAISCFIAAHEVKLSHGTAAGLVVLMILFFFYRNNIGKTMTESLGLSLGAIGFAALWRGARQHQMKVIWVGIFLMTLALNARAGAFFLLPALILWGTWHFRNQSRWSLSFLVGGTISAFAGFLLNFVLLKLLASSGMAFSNFSFTLYGLTVGGKGWAQIFIDHPELSKFNELEFSRRVYLLAYQAFCSNPMGLLKGSVKALQDYFNAAQLGAFSFVYPWYTAREGVMTRIVLYGLSGLGIIGVFLKRWTSNNSMILAAVVGILVSVPFAPPIDADSMRVYAATIPISAALVALGLTFSLNRFNLGWQVQAPRDLFSSRASIFFGIALALFCFLGPIATKILARPPKLEHLACDPGKETLYLRLTSGSFLNLVPDYSIQQTYLPNIRVSDFRREVANLSLYPELVKELMSLEPGNTVVQTLNLGDPLRSSAPNIWLVIDSHLMPSSPGIVRVCAKQTDNQWLRQYRFYYAESIQSVPERAR
jgi:hypothetical protein